VVSKDWIGSSDVDAVDLYDRGVLCVLTWDGLSTGSPYSRAGSRRIRDD
jgi:hypothetical protein